MLIFDMCCHFIAIYFNTTIKIAAILLLVLEHRRSYLVSPSYLLFGDILFIYYGNIIRVDMKAIKNVDLIFVVCLRLTIVYCSACHQTSSGGFENTDTGNVVCYFKGKLK